MSDIYAQINIKYRVDRIMGLITFVIIWPLLLFIALAIKLDDHHEVFFKQKRIGLNGNPFLIWKFRTMIPDADRFLNKNGAVANVNRVTKMGKLLRYLSLDELPQVINIIKGEMSFIGPRPGLVEQYHKFSEWQKRRVLMKPGVTGLAQINGRNTLLWSKRVEYDIQYVDNYSIWLDLKIFLQTIRVVIKREGFILDRNPEQVNDLPKLD